MFPEFQAQNINFGWIEVICGSMFSGKTEELLRRLRRAQLAKQKVEIFKPRTDIRYSATEVVSHDANTIISTPVDTSTSILLYASEANVVGIDEAHFFDPALPHVCQTLANMGKRVIIAGLDMDFKARPFGPMPQLIACAEYVTKLHAICMHCGALAAFSHRKNNDSIQLQLGEKDLYEPLCRLCFNNQQNNKSDK
jgi:thymidine kinase